MVSPVAGRVKAVVRGERRKVIRIEVEADNSAEVKGPELCTSRPTRIRQSVFSQKAVCLPLCGKRPYDIVPNPDDSVRDIFITAFDSAPLHHRLPFFMLPFR